MINQQSSNDPLHGKTLQMIITHLVEMYGWEELANLIPINCFKSNMQPLKITEEGFILLVPANLGAVPCVASKTA